MFITASKDKEKRLLERASSQGGYFTAQQACKAGYSYRLHHYHRTAGHWQEIERGVFRLAGYPNTPHEDLIRWSLWSRNRQDIPQAVISHETALAVHEMGDVMPGKVHFIVPEGFRKKPAGGCMLHKDFLLPEEIEERQGFSVTTPIRTIQDVTEGSLAPDYLEKAIRDGLNRGLIALQDIQNLHLSKKAKEKMKLAMDQLKQNPVW